MFETLQRLLDSSDSPDFVEVVLLHKNILKNAYQKVQKVRNSIPQANIDLDERFWMAADILSRHGEELPRFNKIKIIQSLHQKMMTKHVFEDNDFTELEAS